MSTVSAGETYLTHDLLSEHRVLADVPPVGRRRLRALHEARDGGLADNPLGERHREDLEVSKYVW